MTKVKESIECWIFNQVTRKILLLHVPISKDSSVSFWQPITGGIEEKESPLEACVREVAEETGLIINEQNLIGWKEIIHVNLPTLNIKKNLFLGIINDSEIIISGEHDEYKWVSPKSVLGSLYWDSNRETWGNIQTLIHNKD
ncbi:NUDIX hydrolase [Sporosarcina sp. FSL K6-3457]|uniref:NUDIX hydrolase n=1 Tax=Sporosarcina sp. FSL K6-3457 TaxID=2978204 RepID=UPI0030FACB36